MAQEQERDEASQGISSGRDDSAEITITPRNVQTAPDSSADPRHRHPNEFDRDTEEYERSVNAFFEISIEHSSPKEAERKDEPDDQLNSNFEAKLMRSDLLRNFVRHVKTVHDVPSSRLESAVNEFIQKYTGLCDAISEFELSASTLRTNSKALTLGRKLVLQNMFDLYSKVLHDFRPRLRPDLPKGLKDYDRAFEYERDREQDKAKVMLTYSLVAAMKDLPGSNVRWRAFEWLVLRRTAILLKSAESWLDVRGKAWDKACAEMWHEKLENEAARTEFVELENARLDRRYRAMIFSENERGVGSILRGGDKWFEERVKALSSSKDWEATARRLADGTLKTWSIGRVLVKIWNKMLESTSERDTELEEVVWKPARARVFSRITPQLFERTLYVPWSKDWNTAWDRKKVNMQTQKSTSRQAEFDHNIWSWLSLWDRGWIIRVVEQRNNFAGFHALPDNSIQWKEIDWVLLRFWWFGVDEWVMRFRDRRRIVSEFKDTCVEFLKELSKMDGSESSHEFNILNKFPTTCKFEEWRIAAKDLDGMKGALDCGDEIQFINLCSSVLDLIGKKLRSKAMNRGVETLIRKQDHFRNTFMDFATVAIFFSSITATTLQFSFTSADHSLSSTIVNLCWFSSLVLSIASASNSFLGAVVHQSPELLRPSPNRDFIFLRNWFKYVSPALLTISGVLFLVGICAFTFMSSNSASNPFTDQGKAIKSVTSFLTSTTFLAIVIVILLSLTKVLHRFFGGSVAVFHLVVSSDVAQIVKHLAIFLLWAFLAYVIFPPLRCLLAIVAHLGDCLPEGHIFGEIISSFAHPAFVKKSYVIRRVKRNRWALRRYTTRFRNRLQGSLSGLKNYWEGIFGKFIRPRLQEEIDADVPEPPIGEEVVELSQVQIAQ